MAAQLREELTTRGAEEVREVVEDPVAMEYRVVNYIMEGNDFFEGVRAILLDKDNSPSWNPATLDGVSDDAVAGHFAPIETELFS